MILNTQESEVDMSNKTYDVLKYIAQIVLPAAAVLYTTLSQIWNLPYGEAIPATIMAIDLFLGALLRISSKGYTPTDFTSETIEEFTGNRGAENE